MSTRIREHLRSNVIAYIALFVAVAIGPAWAGVARNSVRTPHIAGNAVKSGKIAPGHVRRSDLGRNAVNGSKVAANSLTGADIDERTLNTASFPRDSAEQILEKLLTVDGVGSGLDADRLDGTSAESFARTGTDAFFSFGGGGTFGPAGCWRDLDLGLPPPPVHADGAAVRDSFGFVHLRGVVRNGCDAAISPIFTLPEGYRPALTEVFGVLTSRSTPTGVNVAPNGDIIPRWTVQKDDWVSLSGITFRCAPSGVNGCP